MDLGEHYSLTKKTADDLLKSTFKKSLTDVSVTELDADLARALIEKIIPYLKECDSRENYKKNGKIVERIQKMSDGIDANTSLNMSIIERKTKSSVLPCSITSGLTTIKRNTYEGITKTVTLRNCGEESYLVMEKQGIIVVNIDHPFGKFLIEADDKEREHEMLLIGAYWCSNVDISKDKFSSIKSAAEEMNKIFSSILSIAAKSYTEKKNSEMTKKTVKAKEVKADVA